MSHIIFATGGTTRVPKTLRHKWLNYEFVTHSAAKKLETVFKDCSVNAVANCLTAGGLWGGFLFAHEICRLLKVTYYPFASMVDLETLSSAIEEFSIDTIICLPSFADKLITISRKQKLKTLKNLFYLGEAFQAESVSKIKDIIPELDIKPLSFTTQETGPIGFQCSKIDGDIYHLYDHIQVKSNPENDELIVSVFYPEDAPLLEHATGDVVHIAYDQSCDCGYHGHTLHLKGRTPTFYNIMGTSISVHDFTNVLNLQGCTLSATDIQLIIVNQFENGVGVLLFIDSRYDIERNALLSSLSSSYLIKDIINKSQFFHVCFMQKSQFIRSSSSEKIKSFFQTTKYPIVLDGDLVEIK
ncbi:hypothetical protein ACRPOS_006280 [Bartonella heixiaziensis]|uniref:hypothetical protein n=1 Tax=Bartonella heixiaziensis TaxID=1461000 RepID=UPI003908A494